MSHVNIFLISIIGLFGCVPLMAFPPAPYYMLYGMVRDQVGQTLSSEGAEVVLLKGGEEIGRTPVSSVWGDRSYELRVKIDQARSGTELYTEKAVSVGGLFSLVVEMNGSVYYPIEVSGTLQAGNGGERTRLDLTLGTDSDGDGLPDVWEEWQLYQAGMYPNAQGAWDLSQLSSDGDFDGDGQSDGFEYIAGTFAGDASETFGMEILGKANGVAELEFYAITGKAYTIESSVDMINWETVSFAVDAPGNASFSSHVAAAVGVVPAYVTPISETHEFYRLTVR